MIKRQKTVMSKLKPKVKAFGFNQKEIQSIAAHIADNLTSAEDASDEDVNAEIDNAIEAVLPILKLGQSYANRVINNLKNEEEEENDDDNDETDDNEDPAPRSKSKKSPNNKGKKSDEEPAWFKKYRESMDEKFAKISGERTADKRKTKLESLLKNTGKFGERILKSYARMKFDDDDAFDEFYAEVEEDLKSENQDRANEGLEKLGAPATGGSSKKQDEKPKVLSEDEIKALAQL